MTRWKRSRYPGVTSFPLTRMLLIGSLALLVIALAGCAAAPTAPATGDTAQATEAPAEEAPVAEATEAPAEEATEAPAEEATEVPAEEATAEETEEATEEGEALTGTAEAGAYIFNAALGCGCHFNRDLGALAGGNAFEGPFGAVYSANITPDEATGIGSLSDQQIIDAFRIGKRADGDNLFIMPHYAGMADQDAADLVVYLRSLDPVENAVPARELNMEVAEFTPAEAPPAVAPMEGAERGGYLAALARCGFCHTPSNEDGSSNMDLFLAGAPFRDIVAPNLTPDELTGLGAWSEQEIADFLATGIYFDGTEAHPGMKGVVDRGIGKLTDEDRLAIAAFLTSLPPIENLPQANQ